MNFNDDLTYDAVMSRLKYNNLTGVFTWIKNDKVAGYLTPLGYISIFIEGHHRLAHRLAWLVTTKTNPVGPLDHIDGVRDNNAIANLREVTATENACNRKKPAHNTSGTIGVCRDKKACVWHARITINGKQIHLGSFKDLEDAITARKEAEVHHNYHKNHGR